MESLIQVTLARLNSGIAGESVPESSQLFQELLKGSQENSILIFDAW
jgi:hypothetical protein